MRKKNLKKISKRTVFLLGVSIFLVLVFVLSFSIYKFLPSHTAEKTHVIKTYPKLDKNLNMVINAVNPIESANSKGMDVVDDRIKILIVLNDQSFVFTQEYGKEELRYGKYIQAQVKFSKVIELASHKKISLLTAPRKGTPGQ